jgi:hypothetical protein
LRFGDKPFLNIRTGHVKYRAPADGNPRRQPEQKDIGNADGNTNNKKTVSERNRNWHRRDRLGRVAS